MSGHYNTKDAQMLLLATAAIESKSGYYISQISGPAKGIWQMEPDTCKDIFINADALQDKEFLFDIFELKTKANIVHPLISSPMYACAMARLKYAMDVKPLPHHMDKEAIWKYYKRIYNTEFGASTEDKFYTAWDKARLNKIVL